MYVYVVNMYIVMTKLKKLERAALRVSFPPFVVLHYTMPREINKQFGASLGNEKFDAQGMNGLQSRTKNRDKSRKKRASQSANKPRTPSH